MIYNVHKSEFKTFGYQLVTLLMWGGLFLLFVFSLINRGNLEPGHLLIYLVSIIGIIGLGKILYDANEVTINSNMKTISFVNRLTRTGITYRFEALDGIVFSSKPARGARINYMYLVKDKKVVKKLSDFVYSNYEDLKSELDKIENLGTITYSFPHNMRILCKRNIIKN